MLASVAPLLMTTFPPPRIVYRPATTEAGAAAVAWPGATSVAPPWRRTVGGGTSQVLRNIIAERILGLPHDIDVEQGKTWSETKGGLAVS